MFVEEPAYVMNKSDVDWCPSINLGHNKINVDALKAASDRAEWTVLRQKRIQEAMASTATVESLTEEIGKDTDSRYGNQETQKTEVSYESKTIQTHCPQFRNISVQTDKDNFFDERNFLADDAKVHYYTGFSNSDLLQYTFEFVMKKLADGEKRSYCWRSFIIVLLKLRLNLGLQDIVFRLNVSVATVSRLFHETLDIMLTRLEWLIKWPAREELWKTTPNCSRASYGTKVVAIVDCYEIKIETPSHLVAKLATWSQYKHANTAKVFIAMCPQGLPLLFPVPGVEGLVINI